MKNFKASYTSNIDKDYFKDKKIINNKFMENIKKWSRSRTIQTLVFMFCFNLWGIISGDLSPTVMMIGNTIFTGLAGIFRIDTKVK